MTSPSHHAWMLLLNRGRARAPFGRNRGNEGAMCTEPQARRHTHLGPETASGAYVAASTAIGVRAVQRLHHDRGLTLQAGVARARIRQAVAHAAKTQRFPLLFSASKGESHEHKTAAVL